MNHVHDKEYDNLDVTDSVCRLYDKLRDQILDSSKKAGETYGIGVMLLRGMAEWINVILERSVLDSFSECRTSNNPEPLEAAERQHLSDILADIVIKHSQLEI